MVNFLQKIQKWQNVPNMKTKIFSYPSIVLATYEKPNSEIGQFSHFWWLKPWKIIQFQFFKFLFGKNWAVKKGLLQIKMCQLLSTCHRFLPDWAWGFLGAKNNFLKISRVTYSSIVHHCVNMAWVAKGSGGLPLLILHAFYRQRVLVTLQQVHAATILMWQAIITGEGSYSLSVFFSVPPLSFFLTCFLW
jgi:hypothetical protein